MMIASGDAGVPLAITAEASRAHRLRGLRRLLELPPAPRTPARPPGPLTREAGTSRMTSSLQRSRTQLHLRNDIVDPDSNRKRDLNCSLEENCRKIMLTGTTSGALRTVGAHLPLSWLNG